MIKLDDKKKNENKGTEDKELVYPLKEKYRLDTAGKLFAYVSCPKIPCVYRFWATMKNKVNVEDLQKAINTVITRFPYYQVKLSRGFFWHYWRKTTDTPKVSSELDFPCTNIPIRVRNIFPYRIIAKDNEIIIEFSHSLTDGTGALIFLRALLSEYLVIQGHIVKNWEDIFRPNEEPKMDEFEYSYRKNFKIGIPELDKIYRAFHIPFNYKKEGISYVTTSKMNVNDVLHASKEWKVTLTEFIVSVYIDTIQEIMFNHSKKRYKKLIRPIRIMVPINARNLVPSNTMRNFTCYVAPDIDPRLGEFSFKEIIEQVHNYKNLLYTQKYLIQQISNFVALETNPLINITPSFLKLLIIKPLYRKGGEALFSAFLTNIGKTSMPPPLNEEVLNIQLLPMHHPYFKSGCALLTYSDILNINFVRSVKENAVEKIFFKKLENLGIKVEVKEIW